LRSWLPPYPLRNDTHPRAKYPEGCEQFDRFRQPTEAQERAADIAAADEAAARHDAAMRCADSMQDFLAGHCAYQYDVSFPSLSRDALDLGCELATATVPQLLCLVMHVRADVRAAAGSQLRKRYEESRGVQS
jgi:hypothetical protein